MDIPQHTCHKNWDGTSTAMEAQIIVEGFLSSVNMHGLKYKKLVGNRNSSVYTKIKNIKPYGPNFYAIIVIKSKNLQNVQNLVRKYGVYFAMFCGSEQE
jgi:cellobiose phosphorylase